LAISRSQNAAVYQAGLVRKARTSNAGLGFIGSPPITSQRDRLENHLRPGTTAGADRRASTATRAKVSRMRPLALSVPARLPETFETPPARRRCATGISTISSP